MGRKKHSVGDRFNKSAIMELTGGEVHEDDGARFPRESGGIKGTHRGLSKKKKEGYGKPKHKKNWDSLDY